ncbi:hypothetical protein NP233_g3536 [Leucocoprinus birnbaumii]|uniref:RPA43 OB domain-containing protein n=1 Tax=Leucocoprinus birnbaumii TaxID=56174 RepID=A0AAD5VX07_9AGAR|nr:hypothetical protein NP233_g3536 [Leucocoprinus birnbaumii]
MPHHTHEHSSKKRKSHDDTASPSKKKPKKSSNTSAESEGEFHVINASLRLSIPPIFANNPRAGVEEMLDSMVMRYIPAFRGVVLSHSNLSFTDNRATIIADCPFLACDVKFDATVWSPKVGMKLAQADEFSEEKSEREEQESAGQWISRKTGEKLGGEHDDLEFTVIGLTVANEMLSLQGSIQLDPFSPAHTARTEVTRHTEEAEAEADDLENEPEDESEDAGSDVDTFQLLGRKAAQAAAADKQKRKLEEPQQQAEAPRKKKRKGQKEGEGSSKPKRKKT